MSAAYLWTADGFKPDAYQALDDLSDVTDAEAVLLPFHVWVEKSEILLAQTNRKLGVRVGSGEDVTLLFQSLHRLSLIALDFPAFNDGRSYSKAELLRAQGFKGELRAVGDVLIDQAALMLRAGFDTLEVHHLVTVKRLQEGALVDTPHYYQPGSGSVPIKGEFSWRRFRE
ncbi:DUF934 domain-containing protein [Paenochrobactrum pullorum]|uniref:DUF934 domain-containing protein n=1 Tax=Paenochrobactrum pullorum TaxID=1324351 RepID=UPI0035BC1050